MLTLKEISQTYTSRLQKLENRFEAEAIFGLVCETILGLDRLQCIQNQDKVLSDKEELKLVQILRRLEHAEPVQYILEESWFYDLRFKVTPSVLIPRQETEELVDWVVKDYRKNKASISILDIGTGSGCIPIALKNSFQQAQVYACDVSMDALAVAQENAKQNKLDVHFFKADILANPEFPLAKFDIIVSNPPYVTQREMEEMQSKVLQHEPHLALFVEDNDPLIFYRTIAKIAQNYLSENGNLYLEINQYLGKEMLSLLAELNFEAELRKDLNGNDRMIKARLKNHNA